MKKKTKIILASIVVLAVLIFIVFFSEDNSPVSITTESFITANPLELSQTGSISQFRSCEGHNFSGYNVNGEEETYRTMKHYIEATESLSGTEQQVKIFAPFSGRISQIAKDPRGTQVYLSPDSDGNGWDFLFFHVDLLPKFNKKGIKVTSGDHIGFANLKGAANFDISLRNFGFKQLNDSPFSYMTEAVLSEYSAVGITLENIIISKEERDASPCKLAPGESGRDAFYARSEVGKSWIKLK